MASNHKIDVDTLREYLNLAIDLANAAGLMMTQASGRNTKVEQKASFADLVTETDKAIEAFVYGELRTRYPTHRFIGEETTTEKVEWTDDPTWIIDPIDGTMNFYHQFPFCCISIGLTINKKLVMGVVYSPFLDKMYTAIKGCGAYLNGRPIRTKPTKALNEALVIAEMGSDRGDEKRNAVFANVAAIGFKSHGVRQIGSAALNICHIAEGGCDAYYEFGIHCWDMAGAAVILREAGGSVIDTKGGEFQLMNRRLIAAATEELAKVISNTLVVHLELPSD